MGVVIFMLKLKSLTFSNIGRFVEEQTIDFTSLGSLVQIDGKNNNTGGSSGAGKSTIFKALEFLLGLNDISNSVLQSRLTKESISVTGLFDLDGIPLKIERGKKLLIDLNGEVTTGSSKLTEEKLDQVIGMPRDLFRKNLHKRQGEGGFFLDMGPSDVHKFLTNCLGLEKEQSKVTILDDRLKTLLETETSLKSAIESNKMGLQAIEGAILSLGSPPVLEIDSEAIEKLKSEHLQASDNHSVYRAHQQAEIEDLERNRPKVVSTPFDRTKIEQLENEIGTILANIAKLEKVELDRQSAIKAKISELQTEVSRLGYSELSRQSDAKAKISSIRAEIGKLEGLENSRQAEVRSKLSLNKIESIRALTLRNEGDRAKEEAGKLAEELKKVRASICPTCEQGWVNDAAKTKDASILAKLQEYKKTVIAGMEAVNRIAILEEGKKQLDLEALPRPYPGISEFIENLKQAELDSRPKPVTAIEAINTQIELLRLESQPQSIPEAIEQKLKSDFKNQELLLARKEERDHQVNEDTRSQAILAGYAAKQHALRQVHEVEIKLLKDEESRALAEFEAAKNKVLSFEESKKRFEESLGKLKVQLSGYSGQLEKKNSELVLISEEIELATESKKAIKSYLSASFEDALDSIGDTATRFIRSIPNMSTATIQFQGLKETKEGKVKEEVTCLISMDGEIGIPIKSLSGGERSSTDLAIDLSVIKFIEERTGKGIDIFVLDEPFTGLDSKNILEALEMLKECSLDKRLLIVDHNPEASQSIENRLTVVRDGLTSKIVQQ
jgi:DNA repair exonuclease SbcCD ATPase subunit